jgi:hypothetical protein
MQTIVSDDAYSTPAQTEDIPAWLTSRALTMFWYSQSRNAR